MKKRNIFRLLLIFGSSLFAAAIMKLFTQDQSWTEIVGWVVFFIAIQSPWLFTDKKYYNCLNWFKKKTSNQ